MGAQVQMRLTRAFSRPVERHVMRVDIATVRLDSSYREMLLEASLILATSLAGVAAIVLAIPISALTHDSTATVARVVDGAESGLLIGCVITVLAHLVRYLFWLARSRARRTVPRDLGELAPRIPLLMSTDWDLVVVAGIVVASAAAR